jgi:quercetin dioxygenase-like cupin family protein
MTAYTLLNLPELATAIQPDSITSRSFYRDDQVKVMLFGFASGQELSEHTSSHAAIIQIVEGEATLTLGADRHEVCAGACIHMSPQLPHSVLAKTPLIMLLYMFQK